MAAAAASEPECESINTMDSRAIAATSRIPDLLDTSVGSFGTNMRKAQPEGETLESEEALEVEISSPKSEKMGTADENKPESESVGTTDGRVFVVTLPIPELPGTSVDRLVPIREVLGLTLSAECDLTPVTIVEIRAVGVAAAWNKEHAHTQHNLRIGDAITQVNGVWWSPRSPNSSQAFIDRLEHEFKHAQARSPGRAHTLTLRICRAVEGDVADRSQPDGERAEKSAETEAAIDQSQSEGETRVSEGAKEAARPTDDNIQATAVRALADAKARRDAERTEAIHRYLEGANAHAVAEASATPSVAAEDALRAALGWRPAH